MTGVMKGNAMYSFVDGTANYSPEKNYAEIKKIVSKMSKKEKWELVMNFEQPIKNTNWDYVAVDTTQ